TPLHDRDACVSLNSPLGGIIDYKLPREALRHDRFGDWPKATLSKNGLAFAVENVIAGIGQFQNAAKQIRLELGGIDPERASANHQKQFQQTDKCRQIKPAQIIAHTWVVFREAR